MYLLPPEGSDPHRYTLIFLDKAHEAENDSTGAIFDYLKYCPNRSRVVLPPSEVSNDMDLLNQLIQKEQQLLPEKDLGRIFVCGFSN